MLLSWLSKTVATLLVIVSCSAVFSIVLSQTVLNSRYLEAQLAATDAYNRLSVAISAEIVKDAGEAGPQLTAQLQHIVTPSILQQKINTTLDQFQAYYTGNGQPPTINVSDLVSQARSSGLPVPENTTLDKPIVLTNNAQIKGLGMYVAGAKLGTIVLVMLLALCLVALAWKRHKFAVLPDMVIAVGVLVGIVAAMFRLIPGAANQYIKFDFSTNAFAGVAHDLAQRIILDIGSRLAVIAAVLLVAGIAGRILVAWLSRRQVSTPIQPIAAPKPESLV